MAEEASTEDQSDAPEAPEGLLWRLKAWAEGGSRRNLYIGVGFVGLTLAMVVSWLALADIAAKPSTATIEMALEALDNGEEDLAEMYVGELQRAGALKAGDYGGPLYVLGALKVREASRQWSIERAQSDYLVASKYLGEARVIGWPEGRESRGLLLLGESLIKSRQLRAGVEILNKALAASEAGLPGARMLLAEAYFTSPKPNYEKTIEQLDLAIADPALDPETRSEAGLRRAEALAALNRGEEAQAAVGEAGGLANPAQQQLVLAKSLIARIKNALGGAPYEQAGDRQAQARALAGEARSALEQARRLDKLATDISRKSYYYLALVDELTGRTDEALRVYNEMRRSQGSYVEGIAAAMSEGDLRRLRGNEEDALRAYRRALQEIDPSSYVSTVLPLNDARKRVRDAHLGFLRQEQFASANELANRVTPLLSRTDQLILLAETRRMWGLALIKEAESEARINREKLKMGRLRLREAGVAFEQLAEARFSSKKFTEDLWAAAESYYQGQSFTGAVRVLDRYLRNEPELRNAAALLMLGEAHLALGDSGRAIEALEECLEFQPNDVASFNARLECAKAYSGRGEVEKAEALLRHNLLKTELDPKSPEWRYSKFELGRLLATGGDHHRAIRELEEAIDRYPDDSKARLSRYLIAEAYRHAAHEPLERLMKAQTVNEQERSREEARGYLTEALKHYKAVQAEITLADSSDRLDRVMLRNCYMLAGEVQFELGQYEDAIKSYSNVSTIYQNEPFVLETLVQVSHCWRRLRDNVRAAGAIQQARSLLTRLPDDADFATSTNLSRAEWSQLLEKLAQF